MDCCKYYITHESQLLFPRVYDNKLILNRSKLASAWTSVWSSDWLSEGEVHHGSCIFPQPSSFCTFNSNRRDLNSNSKTVPLFYDILVLLERKKNSPLPRLYFISVHMLRFQQTTAAEQDNMRNTLENYSENLCTAEQTLTQIQVQNSTGINASVSAHRKYI